MGVVISDASPLVHLSTIARFDLLRSLYTSLLIPPAVLSEVTIAGQGRPGALELASAIEAKWIEVRSPQAATLTHQALQGLDPGEQEALALALDSKADFVLIDELRGRSAARRIGVRAIGTLGVLIVAKRRGLLPTLRGELERVRRLSQLQLTPELEQLVLELAGE